MQITPLVSLCTYLVFIFLTTDVTAASSNIEVLHYSTQITPDIDQKNLVGSVKIEYRYDLKKTSHHQANTEEFLKLNIGDLEIDSVSENDEPRLFQKSGSKLLIHLPFPEKNLSTDTSTKSQLNIAYHGSPKDGMRFLPEHRQVFTAFSSSQWMPCIDAPDQRATLELSLTLPSDLIVAGNGKLISTTDVGNGKQRSKWRQDHPMPCYLFGFAAGPFREVTEQFEHIRLRYLASPNFTEEELKRIFKETSTMINFYQNKAGVAYPDSTYTQVLVNAPAAQEMDSIAVMSERYGQRVLTDPKKIWLGAHELSHQWWGNHVTNHAWTEFWLNEGMASFMNAAYLEHRFGRETYLAQMEATKLQYEKLVAAGKDKALVFQNWDHPSAEDRSLAYDKGAYVVHLLREQLGEAAFWSGIKIYTSANWGKSVRSKDFQIAMEQASKSDLSEFFNQWIYSSGAIPSK